MGVISYKKVSMSDAAWDGPKHVAACESEREALRALHMWVDPDGDPEAKDSYKFPFRFVDDGKPGDGSIKACQSIISVVNGGRGGADIPDGDREEVYNVAAKHLKDADVEPPQFMKSGKTHRRISRVEPPQFKKSGKTHRRISRDERTFRRSAVVEILTPDDDVEEPRVYKCRALTYDVVDCYNSKFRRGCASKGLAESLPVIAWSHDWREPIGRALEWEDKADGLYVSFRLDEHESVPRALQAAHQLASGTLTDVSIGFSIDGPDDVIWSEDWVEPDEFVSIRINEISIVLAGAVPGAEILTGANMRSAVDRWMDAREAERIATELAAGGIDLLEALTRVRAATQARTIAVSKPKESDEPKDDENDPVPIGEDELELAKSALADSVRSWT